MLARVPKVRHFRIVNVLDTFTKNSPIHKFALDDLLLNPVLFNDLRELEITNTRVDYIVADALSLLPNLSIVKLENVGLRAIIDHYFSDELPMVVGENHEVDFSDDRVNWLANRRLQRVYLGRENGGTFEFRDEDLCYFAALGPNTTVYLYDNLDSEQGVTCTCTIYWIYRYIQRE